MALNYRKIANMINYLLVHPALTDDQLIEGCTQAAQLQVGSICIKPYALPEAVNILKGSGVVIGTVVSYPHGNCDTHVKEEEARQAIMDGAQELAMVTNLGKALSENWEFVEFEIQSVLQLCREHGTILKVIFENDFLGEEEIMELSKICTSLRVPYAVTSTGFGYIRQPSGQYAHKGSVITDLEIMTQFINKPTKIEAVGGFASLDALLRLKKMGVDRFGISSPAEILRELRERLKEGALQQ